MKIFGTLFLILGFIPLAYLSYKEEDMKTHWKMMISAFCGAFMEGGFLLLLC